MDGVNGIDYGLGVKPHQWPPVRHQGDDTDLGSTDVLLMSDVLVSGDENIVACFLCKAYEGSVGDSRPTFFAGGLDDVLLQIAA